MKIVFFRHSLLNRGGDKMVAQHASHLARAGHDVVITANHIDTLFPLDDHIRIEKISFTGKGGTLLSALINKFEADFVIADIISLACLLYMRNRNRTIYFAQDYDESYYSSALAKYFIRLLYFVGLRLFRLKTIAVAEHLSEIFHRRFGLNSILVENGVDPKLFYPEPDPELLSYKAGRKSVLVLSRNDPRKGFDIAVSVLKSLPAKIHEDIEIWTVGETTVDIFKHFKHYRDFGYVEESKLRQIMSSSDIFFYPTRHEGFPLMVIEAFACRCPVLTTEAVPYGKNYENALVGKIEDVKGLTNLLIELLNDMNLRQLVSDNGEQFAKNCTLARSLDDFSGTLGSIFMKVHKK